MQFPAIHIVNYTLPEQSRNPHCSLFSSAELPLCGDNTRGPWATNRLNSNLPNTPLQHVSQTNRCIVGMDGGNPPRQNRFIVHSYEQCPMNPIASQRTLEECACTLFTEALGIYATLSKIQNEKEINLQNCSLPTKSILSMFIVHLYVIWIT